MGPGVYELDISFPPYAAPTIHHFKTLRDTPVQRGAGVAVARTTRRAWSSSEVNLSPLGESSAERREPCSPSLLPH